MHHSSRLRVTGLSLYFCVSRLWLLFTRQRSHAWFLCIHRLLHSLIKLRLIWLATCDRPRVKRRRKVKKQLSYVICDACAWRASRRHGGLHGHQLRAETFPSKDWTSDCTACDCNTVAPIGWMSLMRSIGPTYSSPSYRFPYRLQVAHAATPAAFDGSTGKMTNVTGNGTSVQQPAGCRMIDARTSCGCCVEWVDGYLDAARIFAAAANAADDGEAATRRRPDRGVEIWGRFVAIPLRGRGTARR